MDLQSKILHKNSSLLGATARLTFPVKPRGEPVKLGSGFDPVDGIPKGAQGFDATDVTETPIKADDPGLYKECIDTVTIDAAAAYHASVHGNAMGTSLNETTSGEFSASVTTESVNIYSALSRRTKIREVDVVKQKLTREAKKELEAGEESFYATYGTHFVNKVTYGIGCFLQYKIEFESSSAQASFSSKFTEKSNYGLASSKVKTNISTSLSESQTKCKFSFLPDTYGYAPDVIFGKDSTDPSQLEPTESNPTVEVNMPVPNFSECQQDYKDHLEDDSNGTDSVAVVYEIRPWIDLDDFRKTLRQNEMSSDWQYLAYDTNVEQLTQELKRLNLIFKSASNFRTSNLYAGETQQTLVGNVENEARSASEKIRTYLQEIRDSGVVISGETVAELTRSDEKFISDDIMKLWQEARSSFRLRFGLQAWAGVKYQADTRISDVNGLKPVGSIAEDGLWHLDTNECDHGVLMTWREVKEASTPNSDSKSVRKLAICTDKGGYNNDSVDLDMTVKIDDMTGQIWVRVNTAEGNWLQVRGREYAASDTNAETISQLSGQHTGLPGYYWISVC